MDREQKHRKLCVFMAKLPFVSGRALEAILQVAKEDELPDGCSRSTFRRARETMVKTITIYGPLHHTVDIDGTDVEVLNPFAALWYAANKCSGFAALLDRAAQHKQPWHIVLYADEVLPGNQLAHKAARKTWCWYWTIIEFGPAALSDEDRFGLKACLLRRTLRSMRKGAAKQPAMKHSSHPEGCMVPAGVRSLHCRRRDRCRHRHSYGQIFGPLLA